MKQLVDKLIRILGGYTDLDDYLDKLERLDKVYALTLLVKKLYNTIGPDDILKQNEYGQWMHKGRPISDNEKKLLIAEATQLQNMKLWEILQDDIKWQANRKMFLLAKNDFDLTAGKLWLYSLDAMNTRLKSMVKGNGDFNKKDG